MEHEVVIRAVITYARPYRMTNAETGEINEGISIQYYAGNMSPLANEDFKGKKIADETLPASCIKEITKVPGLYECYANMQTVYVKGRENSKDKDISAIKIQSVKHVSDITANAPASASK